MGFENDCPVAAAFFPKQVMYQNAFHVVCPYKSQSLIFFS